MDKVIFEYLNKKNRHVNINEMLEDELFNNISYSVLEKKLLELTLCKAISRNVDEGISYYFIKNK